MAGAELAEPGPRPGTACPDAGAGASAGGAPGAGGEAARRRAERRAARIASGASELEQRLADLLRGGLASAAASAYDRWDETAARMVDAQAPGLASRVRELASVAGSGAGADRASRLLEECALLHTLNQGYLRVDELPEALAATVRARVGITADTATLLATSAPVRDDWLVLAQQDADDGRLITRRVWLRGRRTGRMALLLSYGPVGRPPELSFPAGVSLDAELAYHPSARPLRAALGTRHSAPVPSPGPPPAGGVAAALAAYGEALRDDPWLESWPVVLGPVIPVRMPSGDWQLVDEEGEAGVPVDARQGDRAAVWQLAAVSGGEAVTVFGECGFRGVVPLGVWGVGGSGPVPL
ncbi:hypothetical protein M1P56_30305 [Streptomyces sp. HU2014]|uniref:hypothetical protein n=1 Tax=Streptomyces sp. HU2014 TaxID=2939414 RepID=UPI00200FC2A4|nr:hypothetical protein [Streptomyces sp. HU2014]UQI48305.1 hypothetical protein M1P56_30305 [Streptomyces sp. HU2014]